MNDVDLESSVPDWLIEYPQLLALFEELGIDYTCGGKSLGVACRERGLDSGALLRLCQNRLQELSSRSFDTLAEDELRD